MSKEIEKFDKKGNLVYYNDGNGLRQWFQFDDDNNEIHYKDNQNDEFWYKYKKNIEYEQIEITKKEFKQIKKRRNKKFTRFEIMDI